MTETESTEQKRQKDISCQEQKPVSKATSPSCHVSDAVPFIRTKFGRQCQSTLDPSPLFFSDKWCGAHENKLMSSWDLRGWSNWLKSPSLLLTSTAAVCRSSFTISTGGICFMIEALHLPPVTGELPQSVAAYGSRKGCSAPRNQRRQKYENHPPSASITTPPSVSCRETRKYWTSVGSELNIHKKGVKSDV